MRGFNGPPKAKAPEKRELRDQANAFDLKARIEQLGHTVLDHGVLPDTVGKLDDHPDFDLARFDLTHILQDRRVEIERLMKAPKKGRAAALERMKEIEEEIAGFEKQYLPFPEPEEMEVSEPLFERGPDFDAKHERVRLSVSVYRLTKRDYFAAFQKLLEDRFELDGPRGKNELSPREEALVQAAEEYGNALNDLWGDTYIGRVGDDFLALFDDMLVRERARLIEQYGPEAHMRRFMEEHGLLDEEPEAKARPKYLTLFIATLAFFFSDPDLFSRHVENQIPPPPPAAAPVLPEDIEALEPALEEFIPPEEALGGPIEDVATVLKAPLVNDPLGSGEMVIDDADLITRMNQELSDGKLDSNERTS